MRFFDFQRTLSSGGKPRPGRREGVRGHRPPKHLARDKAQTRGQPYLVVAGPISPPAHPLFLFIMTHNTAPQMKIAISAALLLGFVQGAAGFACTWNGAGSSYVYRECSSSLLPGHTWTLDGQPNMPPPLPPSLNGAATDEVTANLFTWENINDYDCIADVDNAYAQTTCCRCATETECNADPP